MDLLLAQNVDIDKLIEQIKQPKGRLRLTEEESLFHLDQVRSLIQQNIELRAELKEAHWYK